jgi:hypothetical protein
MSGNGSKPRWRLVLRPKWLCWHAFAVIAIIGMLWLGDWQLHRALAGNELSWAYTFEWPIFAVFGVYFWARTLRDELRLPASAGGSGAETAGAGGAGTGAADGRRQTETGAAYVARLTAEVRGHGRWHGFR